MFLMIWHIRFSEEVFVRVFTFSIFSNDMLGNTWKTETFLLLLPNYPPPPSRSPRDCKTDYHKENICEEVRFGLLSGKKKGWVPSALCNGGYKSSLNCIESYNSCGDALDEYLQYHSAIPCHVASCPWRETRVRWSLVSCPKYS